MDSGAATPNVERVVIPKLYETELQTVIGALGDMKQSAVRWENAGTSNTGVLISDTMMFQRADPQPSDANLGSFYGLAMPLVKRGVPAEPVQIESAAAPGFLNRYKLLLLTYEGQKPPKPEFHNALAKWVRDGGALVVVDDDGDKYNAVREWWNSAPHSYTTPRQHLFEALGISKDATGLHRVGRGVVVREAVSPAALTYKEDGAERVRKAARQAAAAVKLVWKETDSLVLRRGPYLVAAGLDESTPNAKPYILHGRYLNLFDPELAVLNTVTVAPRSRMLLLDLNSVKSDGPRWWRPPAVCATKRPMARHYNSGPTVSAGPTPLSRSQPTAHLWRCWLTANHWIPPSTTIPGACCACGSRIRSNP